MARYFAPFLLVLATLIALVLPQLGLCAATLTFEYDVFISFCGEDTRTNFQAYLLAALNHEKIRAYRDDVDLPRGEEIGPEILKAIEKSRIAVVVLSRNYAASRFCLDELVKIMECRSLLNQRVLPIFYDVTPSEVLRHNGYLAEAILNGSEDEVNNWKAALKDVANLAGLQLRPHCPEPEFIKDIVKDIKKSLGRSWYHLFDRYYHIFSVKYYFILLVILIFSYLYHQFALDMY